MAALHSHMEGESVRHSPCTTPRLVAIVHTPWYSSNAAHYREVECLRQALEVCPLQGVAMVSPCLR